MTREDLIKEAFNHLNAFKRSRALEQVEREKMNHDKAMQHRLHQFENVDKLELTLRAIQKNYRIEEATNNK